MIVANLKRKLAAVVRAGERKAITLCYHRVAEASVDPWSLSVSARNFEEQLKVLERYFTVVGIPELVTNFTAVASRKTVCISFDDGYTDNYTAAFPLLKKYGLPACFFIASAFVGQTNYYWWDEITDIFLSRQILPGMLEIKIGDGQYRFELADSAVLSGDEIEKLKTWKYHQSTLSRRCEIYLKLWELLRPLPYSEQLALVQSIKEWSGLPEQPSNSDRLPMTVQQLQNIAKESLFTIGLHTMHHMALGFHPSDQQEKEILGSQVQLNQMTGKHSTVISFPYGSYNEESLSLVRKHSLLAGFTSEKRIQTTRSDKYKLGRYTVKDWNGETFKRKLDAWFSES